MNVVFKKITEDNLKLACKIQNEIFPKENAKANYLEQINNDSSKKEMDYNIVYLDDNPIGITGLYSYNEYPLDAWLGWFGILNSFRNKGYGRLVLRKTIEMAKDKGYKNIRIYTDEFATKAQHLYESEGFIKESYDREDDKDEFFIAKVYIYSKSLNNRQIDLWNNKIIWLKEQGRKEQLYK